MAATIIPLGGIAGRRMASDRAWWHGRMDAARGFSRRARSSLLACFLESALSPSFPSGQPSRSVLSMRPETMAL